MTTVYLTVTEVLAIHDDQIDRYGGSAQPNIHVGAKRPTSEILVPR